MAFRHESRGADGTEQEVIHFLLLKQTALLFQGPPSRYQLGLFLEVVRFLQYSPVRSPQAHQVMVKLRAIANQWLRIPSFGTCAGPRKAPTCGFS